MKVQKIGTLVVALAIAGSLLVATPAQADPSPQPDAKAPTGTCWLDLGTNLSQCFTDDKAFKAAVRAQTGTDVVYPSASTVTAKSGAAQALAGTYVLAIMYWSANYADASWVLTSPYSTLCSSYSYNIDVISGSWNNQIGSFITYGTCKVRLSELTYQGGSHLGPYTSRPTLGLMNDQASSIWITG